MQKNISINVTSEWVFQKLSEEIEISRAGNIRIRNYEGQQNNFIKKALDALKIPYTVSKNFNEYRKDFSFRYLFKMVDIKEECPMMYSDMEIERSRMVKTKITSNNSWSNINYWSK